MSEKALTVLNALLVETFNDILKVEEQAMRAATGGRLTINEVHVLLSLIHIWTATCIGLIPTGASTAAAACGPPCATSWCWICPGRTW